MPTILVVDDDAPIREMLAMILRSDGFAVVTAQNGDEALRISHTRERHIDLVISDLEMPGIDGAHLASEIRSEHPSLPVLLISGSGRHTDAASLPISGFLSKPFRLPEFLKTVRQLISKQPQHAAA